MATKETTPPQPSDKQGTTAKVGESVRSAAERAGAATKSTASKFTESVKSASGKVAETVKKHPYTTAAAVGGTAAAAAGAVAGKKYYDKRKAKDIVDEVGLPEMRAGEPEVKPSAD